MLTSMRFENDTLFLLDQRLLPRISEWMACPGVTATAAAIEGMAVRGAPAIGCAAAFGLVAEVSRYPQVAWDAVAERFAADIDRLGETRPTAVNLFHSLQEMQSAASRGQATVAEALPTLRQTAWRLYEEDLATCRAIGDHGREHITQLFGRPVTVLTHCNTGALATAGFGTALGVIRALAAAEQLTHVYAGETRPYLQGSRLTAYELAYEHIPHAIIVDSAAAALMASGAIDAIIVGADRIVSNGDTANKIGTYSLAVAAHYHSIPFFVAAPLTTFDPQTASGRDITIEQRPATEIHQIMQQRITADDAQAHNPSFDITPAALISAIFTECGVLEPPYRESLGLVAQEKASERGADHAV